MRQETLANHRLELRHQHKVKLPWEESEGAKVKSQGMIDMQAEVVKEIAWKHAIEREVGA